MGARTVFAKMITTFICKECKREWVKLAGDVIMPPESCPFCEIAVVAQTNEYIKTLQDRIHELEGWLRIYMLLRRTHKDHRRALLVMNGKLQEDNGKLRHDIASWLQLARRQYAEMSHNDGICPTLKGINETEKLLNVELTGAGEKDSEGR